MQTRHTIKAESASKPADEAVSARFAALPKEICSANCSNILAFSQQVEEKAAEGAAAEQQEQQQSAAWKFVCVVCDNKANARALSLTLFKCSELCYIIHAQAAAAATHTDTHV